MSINSRDLFKYKLNYTMLKEHVTRKNVTQQIENVIKINREDTIHFYDLLLCNTTI